tara:strand:- start:21 stop:410 length:390 start_codon:yes stop_codon:yes gene_type:complete
MSVDKFEGDTTYTSPYKSGYLDLVHFIKVNEVVYMSLKAPGSTPNVGKEGVVVLLENGDKIEKPEAKIDVDVNAAAGYDYTAFFTLDKSDIEKLKASPITDLRLYIYDAKILKKKALKYLEYIKCIDAL